ncbi:MAG TPA: DUF2298 domain-containing protein [Anaerolineaceae bacterium]|nr:DUF2298 domain-containing protein [Anaerolineaceae bacterium]HPN50200.1 DUF2298 domain-containing protein [Anaerolineaceae bacterium]
MTQSHQDDAQTDSFGFSLKNILTLLALVVILAGGLYFRTVGVNWDENKHLHPDERFFTWVTTDITPVDSLSNYFNTAQSTLNPHNVGHGFFVYGTLPLFMVRYIAQAANLSGFDAVTILGRQVSSLLDLLTVLVVFLIGLRLYNRRVGLLAAAFYACAVLPIQLSHYYTVDTFLTFFGFVAVYFAVHVLTEKEETPAALAPAPAEGEPPAAPAPAARKSLMEELLPYILFGLAAGMAAACKINAGAVAALLPAALLMRLLKSPKEGLKRRALNYLGYLAVGALVAMITFRIFQPYAFSGPGFLDVSLNPAWISNIRELMNQASGDVDFPPALQWANRPVWFGLSNLVGWGLGYPLGILACLGFLWMGWRIWKGEWNRHLLLWTWTLLYFIWQGTAWVSSMRYLILLYPAMAILAAWAVDALWKKGETSETFGGFWRIIAWGTGAGVVVLTLLYAFAFTRIYDRPMTRVEASRWILQNIPAAINLKVNTGSGVTMHPLPYRQGVTIYPGQPFTVAFQPRITAAVTQISIAHLQDQSGGTALKTIGFDIYDAANPEQILGSTMLVNEFIPRGEDQPVQVLFPEPVPVEAGHTYYLRASMLVGEANLLAYGSLILNYVTPESRSETQALLNLAQRIDANQPYSMIITAASSGTVSEVVLDDVVDMLALPDEKTLRLSISAEGDQPQMVSASVSGSFLPDSTGHGQSYTLTLDKPLQFNKGTHYSVSLDVQGPGSLALYGSAPVHESSWDDALPQSVDNFSPYDTMGGLYRGDLNFEMYWDDSEAKLDRFINNLDQADTIFISSNRQWGTTIRVPQRYPLTTVYYRELLGCPEGEDLFWCYSVAKPGMFKGNLGFDLVQVFQSEPSLGSIELNSQFAEEAFSVYDHPKVLIFRKSADYSPEKMREILRAVDLSHVQHITPKQASGAQKEIPSMMMSEERTRQQQAGGTWSELYDRESLLNQNPALAVVVWYLVVMVLGWLIYPVTRLAFPGLRDRGYPLSRLIVLLLLAFFNWFLGSMGIPFTRENITIVIVVLVLVSLGLALIQRKALWRDIRERWQSILCVEIVFLVFFTLFLLVRMANPDLWHPYKGGEKPMDFSYFNAVLKSTYFPPYDPWYAGGTLNYYYYGFMVSGVLVKWLGIIPATAYNLILPTWFAILAVSTFSVVWNLVQTLRGDQENQGFAIQMGSAAAVMMGVAGNLGTVRQYWHSFQRLAAPGGNIENADFFTRWGWSFEGFFKWLSGTPFSFYPGDWYWVPSRAIPGEPITEFPFFTFLYADPHAHLFALPITVTALAWAASVVLGRGRWGEEDGSHRWLSLAVSLFTAGVVIGSLFPTNTWDYPVYLVLAVVALIYAIWRMKLPEMLVNLVDHRIIRLGLCAIFPGLLALLTRVLYQPYYNSYGLGYNEFFFWEGDKTPFWSYMTHWGLFLYIIFSWMVWEAIDWMKHTPMTSLVKLRPYRGVIYGVLAAFFLVVVFLTVFYKVQVTWVTLLLGLIALVLLLRPDQPDAKRFILFLVGTAMVITLVVELMALRGDLGRMNVVFKFYLQAWVLLAISAAAGLGWTLEKIWTWRTRWMAIFLTGLVLLGTGAMLFPLVGGKDKMTDRMADNAPFTVDGMAYMQYATYAENAVPMDLSQDYRGIQWMQDNVKGSPVIVEANVPEYRWGTRYTIYTGLPGVVGWNWHERQQRAAWQADFRITDRIGEIEKFYNTTSIEEARAFLEKYNVKYIIVGQLERIVYPAGLAKFETPDITAPWHEVYRDQSTVIYEVNP